MNRLLILVVLLLSVSNAWAEWTWVRASGEQTDYLDLATIRRSGNLVQVWELYNFETSHQTSAGKRFLSAKVEAQYDCQGKQVRTLSGSDFSQNMGKGKVVFSGSTSNARWEPVKPESVGETILKIVCDKK